MDIGSIAAVMTVLGVILGGFRWLADNFKSQLDAKLDALKSELATKVDRLGQQLKEQFQAQLLEARAAWKDELARSLSAAKDEWLQEMEDLKGQQESTSTRLAQTDAKVERVTDALGILFRATADRKGESAGAYRQAAEELTQNSADQPRDSDADSQ